MAMAVAGQSARRTTRKAATSKSLDGDFGFWFLIAIQA
jgi:hypothetical protein